MDKVYVIYLDGKMYTDNGRKCAYLKEGSAKQVVSADSKKLAENMFKEQNQCRPYWYELGKNIEQEWINKARARFEIREFVENK